MPADKQRIERSRKTAQALYPVLTRQARRPFVLEITGTPKAGKTTLIGMLDSFLRACGWRVHVLRERASECPLPMKGHFFFNTWTTGTMLAGLLDAVDREYDIVILDRGIFDALIWLKMQERQGQISSEEKATFEAFVKLDRWRSLVDRVCLIETTPTTAMKRENGSRLIRRSGSIMKPERLREFNEAMAELSAASGGDFDLFPLPNRGDAKAGALRLIEALLPSIRAWCDPDIAVVRRTDAERLVSGGAVPWTTAFQKQLFRYIRYRRRSKVEGDGRWVQIVVCGVQTHADEVFHVVRRPARDRPPHERDNTALIWRGCHLEKPQNGVLRVKDFRDQLKERLRNDLHLGDLPSSARPMGVVWNPDGQEPGHLGTMFQVAVPANLAEWLDEQNFKTNGRGYSLESSFVWPDELTADALEKKGYTLEEWSRSVLDAGWLA